MDLRVVVVGLETRTGEAGTRFARTIRRPQLSPPLANPGKRHEAADISRHHGQIDAGLGEIAADLTQRFGKLLRLVERHAGLEGGEAAWLQRALHPVVEGFAEQGLSRPHRIGPVGHDQVETGAILAAPQIFEGIGNLDFQPPVALRLGVDGGEMLLAQLHHTAVDVDQHHLFHAAVLQRLVGDGEIAAAHDHHPLHAAMLQHRQMRQHFGIGAFVAGGDLNNAIQRHHPAVRRRVKDLDLLITGLFRRQRLSHRLEGLCVTVVEAFFDCDGHRETFQIVTMRRQLLCCWMGILPGCVLRLRHLEGPPSRRVGRSL